MAATSWVTVSWVATASSRIVESSPRRRRLEPEQSRVVFSAGGREESASFTNAALFQGGYQIYTSIDLSLNDAVQTVIRPAAGGITFASGVGTETVTVQDPGALFAGEAWIPVVIGAGLALLVHLFKATTRAGANTATAGAAAPVLSTAEDTAAALLALTAVFIPVFVVVLLVIIVATLWLLGRWVLRRRRGDRLMSPEDRYFAV